MGSVLSWLFSEIGALIKQSIRDQIPPLKAPRKDKHEAIDKKIDQELAKK